MIGPFLADGKNNDASIAKNIFMNNEEDILNWLKEDDIIIVDRGFRDAVSTINDFGYKVQMPDFLNGKKQLSCEEANHSRCVTKVRWIIEGGMFMIEPLNFQYILANPSLQSMEKSNSGGILHRSSRTQAPHPWVCI